MELNCGNLTLICRQHAYFDRSITKNSLQTYVRFKTLYTLLQRGIPPTWRRLLLQTKRRHSHSVYCCFSRYWRSEVKFYLTPDGYNNQTVKYNIAV